jgi:hypothetical protein
MKMILNIVIVTSLSLLACSNKFSKYKAEVATTKILLNHIVNEDTAAIKKMLGVNHEEIGLSDLEINSLIESINITLKQNNKNSFPEFKFREYPKDSPNLVDVIVPLKYAEGGEEKIDDYIIVSFVKYIEKGKVFNFDIVKSIPKNFDDLSPPK